ncbi:hypothetical protein ACFLWY_00605 [Chloroflexota bacterium]
MLSLRGGGVDKEGSQDGDGIAASGYETSYVIASAYLKQPAPEQRAKTANQRVAHGEDAE